MLSFFKNVEVIGPGTPIDPTAHVAHVRIDRFDAQETVPSTAGPGMNSQVYGRLTWSFALLPSKGRDYLFSYSDTTTGDYPLVRTGEVATMIESTYVRAIEQMVHRFIEDGAYRALLSLDEIPADTPPENFHQGESPLSNEVGHNEVPRSESTTPNRQDAPPLVDDQNMR